MIFTVEQTRLIRQGRMTATLLPVTSNPQRRLQILRRRVTEHDPDGQPVGWHVEIVHTNDGQPVYITITNNTVADLATIHLRDARACACRTRDELTEQWHALHPRSPQVRVIRFALGDIRDAPRLLAASMARRNYTASPRLAATGEPEALTTEQLNELAILNRQKDTRRTHQATQNLAAQTDSQRLARIEAAADRMNLNLRRELRVITDRVERTEKTAATRNPSDDVL